MSPSAYSSLSVSRGHRLQWERRIQPRNPGFQLFHRHSPAPQHVAETRSRVPARPQLTRRHIPDLPRCLSSLSTASIIVHLLPP